MLASHTKLTVTETGTYTFSLESVGTKFLKIGQTNEAG